MSTMAMVSTGKTLSAGVLIVSLAFIATFVVPAILTGKESIEDSALVLRELNRIAHTDCMDLWDYKTQSMERRAKILERELRDSGAMDGPYSLDHFESEYNCELETRIGDRRGDGGASLCSPNVFAERDDCVSYSILAETDHNAMDHELANEMGCKARVLEPATRVNVEAFKSSEIKMMEIKNDEQRHVKAVESEPQLLLGDLATVMEVFGDHSYRIDVLRINCPGCDAKMYQDIFQLISEDKLRVGQMVLRLKNAAPEIVKLVDEKRKELGFLVTGKYIQSSCDGRCADVAMIHRGEARNMYRRLFCKDATYSTRSQ